MAQQIKGLEDEMICRLSLKPLADLLDLLRSVSDAETAYEATLTSRVQRKADACGWLGGASGGEARVDLTATLIFMSD